MPGKMAVRWRGYFQKMVTGLPAALVAGYVGYDQFSFRVQRFSFIWTQDWDGERRGYVSVTTL
jgi:hypothetical protein